MNRTVSEKFLTDKSTGLGRGPVSVDIIRVPAIFEQEKEHIFRKGWLFAGRVEQILNEGDFFVRSVPTFEMSLIFVRGSDGQVRGFHNACRHRGNHVCLAISLGNCKYFTCSFHGWSYDPQGKLKGLTDEERFFDVERDNLGLIPVATEVWEGFIFFSLAPEPRHSLAHYLGALGEAFAGYPFDLGTTRAQFTCTFKSNWKNVVDSFCEIYPIPFLHKRSIGSTLAASANPFGHLIDALQYGNHRTASMWGNKDYHPKFVQGLGYQYAVGDPITGGRARSEPLPKGVNPSRSSDWAVDVSVFFPNFLTAIGANTYFTHQMWPLAVDETQYEMTYCFPEPNNAAERFSQEYFFVELRDLLIEDLNTFERAQANVNNATIREFHFQDHEVVLRMHYATIRRCLSDAAAESLGDTNKV
jgi:glycine betaine catabolism A